MGAPRLQGHPSFENLFNAWVRWNLSFEIIESSENWAGVMKQTSAPQELWWPQAIQSALIGKNSKRNHIHEGNIYVWSFSPDQSDDGRIVGVWGSLQILDRVIEDNLQDLEYQRLEEMAQLSSGISHEINNPLSVILGKSHLLLQQLEPLDVVLDREALMQFAKKIIMHSERIAKIVAGLKTFSRDASNDPLKKTSTLEIIEESVALCAEKKRITGCIISTVGVDAKHFMLCRPTQSLQILVNLINNAIDGTSDTPLPLIEISTRVKAANVEILVKDNGSGIVPSLQEKIFQSFFTTKEAGKGTGLGLSISRRLAHANDGDLYLDKSTDQGSCFILSLKRAD